MLTIRRGDERGRFDWGWLDTRHTFSFGDYHDPRHMGFRALRVINEDRVTPGAGFPTHPHRDMEIVTYVLDGAIAHKDSMGNGSTIRPGDVQRMSAGTGVAHSEYNASREEPAHFLQIWVIPDRRGHAPGYEQKAFPADEKRARLRLVASRAGRDGSVRWNQDADLFVTLLEPGERVVHELASGRHAWVQVARGAIAIDGQPLRAGDGAAASDVAALAIEATEPSEVLVFDLG